MHRAEIGGGAQLIRFGQFLAAEAKHDVLVECSADRRDGGGIERLAQIDPGDFSPKRRSERRD